jgi:hypothetical protein
LNDADWLNKTYFFVSVSASSTIDQHQSFLSIKPNNVYSEKDNKKQVKKTELQLLGSSGFIENEVELNSKNLLLNSASNIFKSAHLQFSNFVLKLKSTLLQKFSLFSFLNHIFQFNNKQKIIDNDSNQVNYSSKTAATKNLLNDHIEIAVENIVGITNEQLEKINQIYNSDSMKDLELKKLAKKSNFKISKHLVYRYLKAVEFAPKYNDKKFFFLVTLLLLLYYDYYHYHFCD